VKTNQETPDLALLFQGIRANSEANENDVLPTIQEEHKG